MSMELDLGLGWRTFVVFLLVFGMAPGFALRLIVLAYPRSHGRRQELVAELYAVDFHRRPLFVFQQLELAASEGIPARWRARRSADGDRSARFVVGRSFTLGAGEGYRGPQACSIVGVNFRQLDYWARTGLLSPSLGTVKGNGARRYSYGDLVELKVIKRLLDAGISLHSVRRAIEALRGSSGELPAAKLVVNGDASILVDSGEKVVELLNGGHAVLSVVSVAGVLQELDAAIQGLVPPTTT